MSALADSQTRAPAGDSQDPARSRPGRETTYTVALPPGLTLLNANDRMHWRRHNVLKQAIVDAAILITRQAKIPHLEQVTIQVVLHPIDNRRRDPHNWYPSIKAAIDGIVRAGGVLVDDDSTHVLDVSIVLGEPIPRGQLVLHITPTFRAET